MEDYVAKLKKLILERRFNEAVKEAQAFIAAQPGNLDAHYCAAVSELSLNNLPNAIEHLMGICRIYEKFEAEFSPQVRVFVGLAAWQCACLLEIHESNLNKRTENVRYTAELAKKIALMVDNVTLSANADLILNRIWKSKKNPEVMFLRRESPSVLQVEPTNHCNLSCRMCPRSQMTRAKGYLSLDMWEQILNGWGKRFFSFRDILFGSAIDILKPRGIKLFFMGEPMLHKQVGEIVRMAKSHGCEILVQTNGVLMANADQRKNLLSAAPTSIAFSLDGLDGGTYEAVRKGSNWDKVVDGVKALHTERQSMGLAGQVKINISTIIPDYTDEAKESAMQFLAPLKDYVDDVYTIKLTRVNELDFFDAEGELKSYSKEAVNPTKSMDSPLCTEPLDKLNVLWDGSVTPCCHDVDGDLVLGNAAEGIDKIWDNPVTRALHQAILDHEIQDYPLCQSCTGQS